MAFPWQKAKDIGDIVGGGFQLARAFGGRKASKSAKRARKTARQARRLAAAAADPTSPTFRNLAAQYDQENRRALIQGIDRIMRENARARARGDVGFGVNPERRDESRTQALARAFMQSREQARREARNTLLAASQGLTGTASALPVAADEERAGQNFDLLTTGISSAVPYAQKIAELFRQRDGFTTFPTSTQRNRYGRLSGSV